MHNYWLDSKYYLFVEAAAVFAIHCILFWWVFGLDSLPLGADGYFHYAIASQLSITNPAQSIEALPFTVLGAQGPDHHWLIHWMQKPLTLLFPDTDSGFAYATIVWAALVPAFLSGVLRHYNIPYAPVIAAIAVWGLYLLPIRLLMFRAQNVAIAMVVLLALSMSARRYLWVAVVVFIFNHAYQGVVLAGAVGFAALLSHALIYRQFDRNLISAALAGLILSLFTSPWFPDNIRFFLVVMMGRILSPVDNIMLTGLEWKAFGFGSSIKVGLVGHACLIFSWLTLAFRWPNREKTTALKRALTFTVLATVFFALYLRHWRMAEFYGPISAIAFGFSLLLLPKSAKPWLAPLVFSMLVAAGIHKFVFKPEFVAHSSKYEGHCQYLAESSAPGAMVFNLPWGAFPYLFKCAPQLRFASGLDGLLLLQGDPEVFRIWYSLSIGALEGIDTSTLNNVLNRTKSSYILLEPRAVPIKDWLLTQVPGSVLVHSDNDGYLISLPGDHASSDD